MKKIIFAIIVFFSATCIVLGKGSETVVFSTKLHCKNCVKKVVENISFVKGVKDLDVSLEKQQIKVVFDPAKTSAATLETEIKKLGYPAEAVETAAPKSDNNAKH